MLGEQFSLIQVREVVLIQNHRVIVPEGFTDDMSWDETICDVPAMKGYNKAYMELREAARLGNMKIRVYLNFVMAKFGDQGVQQIVTTGNANPRDSTWLLRNCWDVCEVPQASTFTRRLRGEVPIPTGAIAEAKAKALRRSSKGGGKRK